MKLYLLILPQDLRDFDCAIGFVVRAANEREARKLAADRHGDEGDEAWKLQATCTELTVEGPPGVILRDFWGA